MGKIITEVMSYAPQSKSVDTPTKGTQSDPFTKSEMETLKAEENWNGGYILKLLLMVAAIICPCTIQSQNTESTFYYWQASGHAEGWFCEDNVIELRTKNGKVIDGYAWTTSDEFDDAREGYYPGGCVLRFSNIRQEDDTIYYDLDFRHVTVLSNAVSVDIYPTEGIPKGYKEWINNRGFMSRPASDKYIIHYRAIVNEQNLSVMTLSDNLTSSDTVRDFKKVSYESAKSANRRMPRRYERRNRYNH